MHRSRSERPPSCTLTFDRSPVRSRRREDRPAASTTATLGRSPMAAGCGVTSPWCEASLRFMSSRGSHCCAHHRRCALARTRYPAPSVATWPARLIPGRKPRLGSPVRIIGRRRRQPPAGGTLRGRSSEIYELSGWTGLDNVTETAVPSYSEKSRSPCGSYPPTPSLASPFANPAP